MEKYRQFSDEKTALNPFVPLWSNYRMPLGRKIVQVLGCPIVLLRLLALLLSFLYLFVVSSLVSPFQFSSSLQFFLQRLLFPVGCRLALLALGFYSIYHDPADHRRLKIRPGQALCVTSLTSNEVIVANYQSCVDVLYLGLFGINQFVFVNKNGVLTQPISLVEAIFSAGTIGGSDKLEKLAALSGPVAVFPEGVRTTGVAILPFTKEMPVTTCIAGLQYSTHGTYTAHHTVGTSVRYHLFWMIWNWTFAQSLRVTWLPREATRKALQEYSGEKNAFVRTLLSRLVHRSVEVEGEWLKRHTEFVKYWNETQKKQGYGKKKQ